MLAKISLSICISCLLFVVMKVEIFSCSWLMIFFPNSIYRQIHWWQFDAKFSLSFHRYSLEKTIYRYSFSLESGYFWDRTSLQSVTAIERAENCASIKRWSEIIKRMSPTIWHAFSAQTPIESVSNRTSAKFDIELKQWQESLVESAGNRDEDQLIWRRWTLIRWNTYLLFCFWPDSRSFSEKVHGEICQLYNEFEWSVANRIISSEQKTDKDKSLDQWETFFRATPINFLFSIVYFFFFEEIL